MASTYTQDRFEEKEYPFTERDFTRIAHMVKQHAGIYLSEQKRPMVYSRLVRRLRALAMDSFEEYLAYLATEEGEDEFPELVNAITTNLTHFFREEHHFQHLQNLLLERMGQRKPIRIWSAGCSSGMEPYSIAMTVQHSLGLYRSKHPGASPAADIRILATDIDTHMLAKAEAGIYPADEYHRLPPMMRTYAKLNTDDETMHIQPTVRQLVVYKPLNLMQTSWPMKGLFDVVFCRNVVIYFDKDTQRQLFARIARQMQPDGWLYIGHSESLNQVSDAFELKGRTMYQRTGGRHGA